MDLPMDGKAAGKAGAAGERMMNVMGGPLGRLGGSRERVCGIGSGRHV